MYYTSQVLCTWIAQVRAYLFVQYGNSLAVHLNASSFHELYISRRRLWPEMNFFQQSISTSAGLAARPRAHNHNSSDSAPVPSAAASSAASASGSSRSSSTHIPAPAGAGSSTSTSAGAPSFRAVCAQVCRVLRARADPKRCDLQVLPRPPMRLSSSLLILTWAETDWSWVDVRQTLYSYE